MSSSRNDNTAADEILGVVTRVVYHAEDTGYTVCAIQPEVRASGPTGLFELKAHSTPATDEITVVGNCAAVWVGESLKASGHWVQHRKHGRQFQADQITCVAPASRDGIRAYLASGMIKGVGDVMAERLVKHFGTDTLRVIDVESARLTEVPGIGAKTRARIKESWEAQKAIRDIIIFLRSHGVGAALSARIYRQYRNDAVAVIMQNPYRLARDVWGVGFKTADKIASSIGIPPEADIRARAGVLYALQAMADDGHCFAPRELLLESAGNLLGIAAEILERAISFETAEHHLVDDGGRIYQAQLYRDEVEIAGKLAELLSGPPGAEHINPEQAIPWAEKRMRIKFAPEQAQALRMALCERVSIITGGPGVGKTTIVRALVDVFTAARLKVALAAPTGRAAKRLAEATGCGAKTLHRLLKFQPQAMTFEHGPGSPLPEDVFVLDEVSMIDTPLMNRFVGALSSRSRLVIVGDSDQLPSVGPGNVLRDLTGSGAVPCTRLDTIFRQKARSWIVHNAHRINRGETFDLPPAGTEADFYFVRADEPEEAISRALELVAKRIPQRFRLDPVRDVQVLTPMRKNQLGADNLNAILQEALNPTGPSLERFGRKFRTGDRVMQIVNNYDKDIFNGDIGLVREVDAAEQAVAVDFDGRLVRYELLDLDELVLAYACSIHKAQGSEYPAVVIVLATQHFKLLQRNLLYTAITRGRKLVCLVGSMKAACIAIRNNDTTLRRTALGERLVRVLAGGRAARQ